MKDRQELAKIAADLADQARGLGCYGVIVALSDEFPEGHSSYQVTSRGRCVEVEGLAARVADYARRIWEGNDSVMIVSRDGRVFEERVPGSKIFVERQTEAFSPGTDGKTTAAAVARDSDGHVVAIYGPGGGGASSSSCGISVVGFAGKDEK